MPELLKNIYNKDLLVRLSKAMNEVVADFNKEAFIADVLDESWENRELKERMSHITEVLNNHLSDDFITNADIILKLIPRLKENGFNADGIECLFLPDFIEKYGIDYYDVSVNAFETITQFVTCEFGVRPFIIKYQDQMMKKMLEWSQHQHPSVRRLASEGSRPRLPWGMAIPTLKKDPSPVLPILENLKNDESETVRRSVANNLNDISKDNEETVIAIATQWFGKTDETNWVVKHACRTLLKQGKPEVMQLFGFGSIDEIEITNFTVKTPAVKIGDNLLFAFTLSNKSDSETKLRLEYGLYYQKANGTLSRKVFKISEKVYDANSSVEIEKKQSFKIITTRKFHVGQHQVSLILNGKEVDKMDFELIL